MEIKKVGVGQTMVIRGITLVPIVRTNTRGWHSGGVVSFWGVKQPVGLLAISPSMKAAFSMTGEPIDIDQLIREIPDIKSVFD